MFTQTERSGQTLTVYREGSGRPIESGRLEGDDRRPNWAAISDLESGRSRVKVNGHLVESGRSDCSNSQQSLLYL